MKLRQALIGAALAVGLWTVTPASAGGYSFGFGYSSGSGHRPYRHYSSGYYCRPSWSLGYTWGAPLYYWCPPPVVYSYYYAPTYSAPRPSYRPSPPVHYYQGGSFTTY